MDFLSQTFFWRAVLISLLIVFLILENLPGHKTKNQAFIVSVVSSFVYCFLDSIFDSGIYRVGSDINAEIIGEFMGAYGIWVLVMPILSYNVVALFYKSKFQDSDN